MGTHDLEHVEVIRALGGVVPHIELLTPGNPILAPGLRPTPDRSGELIIEGGTRGLACDVVANLERFQSYRDSHWLAMHHGRRR